MEDRKYFSKGTKLGGIYRGHVVMKLTGDVNLESVRNQLDVLHDMTDWDGEGLERLASDMNYELVENFFK